MQFLRVLKQMTTTSRLVGVVLCFLISTQVILLYLEGTYLWNPSLQEEDTMVVERIIAPEAEEWRQGQFLVNRFYKSEGFGVDGINPEDITLALHGSVDRLHQLIEYGRVWDGPISLSVFAPGLDASFLDDAIDGLRLCWPALRKSVTFHVVYPQSLSADMSEVGSFVYLSCKDIIRRLRRRKVIDWKGKTLSYPHNVMRNVAHSGVITQWVLHVDAEIVPTASLRKRFLHFIKNFEENPTHARKSSNVFVLPVFEVRNDGLLINDKLELLKAIEEKNARPFSQEICPESHKATNYEKWLKSGDDNVETKLNVSYTVSYTQWWEPYFIAPRTSPRYDERVTSYGYDRLFHICVLQSQGYNFHVLNDEFLKYRGFRWKHKVSREEKWKREHWTEFRRSFKELLKRLNYSNAIFRNCFL